MSDPSVGNIPQSEGVISSGATDTSVECTQAMVVSPESVPSNSPVSFPYLSPEQGLGVNIGAIEFESDGIGILNGTSEGSSLPSDDQQEMVAVILTNGTQLSPKPAPLLAQPTDLGNFPQKEWLDSLESDNVKRTLLKCNEKILAGKNPSHCVRCGKYKDTKDNVKSHIISETLLKTMQTVYCNDSKHFLCDIRGGATNAKNYTYYLLCKTCENNLDIKCPTCRKGSDECKCSKKDSEEILGRILLVLSGEDKKSCGNQDCRTARMLAEIMLRGIFVLENDCLMFLLDNYRGKVANLWKFAGGTNESTEMYFFLLPNKPIADGCPIELVLWAPQQTVYCETEHGTFLYTQFSRFHIVLPLDPSSVSHFQKYKPDDILQKTIGFTTRDYPEVQYEKEQVTFKRADDKGKLFPEILIQMNAKRYLRSLEIEKQTKDALTLAFTKTLSLWSNRFIIETNVSKNKESKTKKVTEPTKEMRGHIPDTSAGSGIGVRVEDTAPYPELHEKAKSGSHLPKWFPATKEQIKIEELQDENERLEKNKKQEEKNKQDVIEALNELKNIIKNPKNINKTSKNLSGILTLIAVLWIFTIVLIIPITIAALIYILKR